MYQVIESRYTRTGAQAFRPSSATSVERRVSGMWRDTVIVTRDGQFVMAVAIGPGGLVWSYGAAGEAGQGAPMACLGLEADSMSVSFDSHGRLVVFACHGMALSYSVCSDTAALQWSAPLQAKLPRVHDAVGVSQVFTQFQDNTLHVGVLVEVQGASGQLFNGCYANWERDGDRLSYTPVYLSGNRDVQVDELFSAMASSSGGYTPAHAGQDYASTQINPILAA